MGEAKKEYMVKWRSENRDKVRAAKKRGYRKHKAVINKRCAEGFKRRYADPEWRGMQLEKSKLWEAALKLKAIVHYGGQCTACGEKNIDLLCLDHSNNDGAEHRRKIGNKVYRWLHKNGYPDDLGLQVLCHNHNFKKEILLRRENAKSPLRHRKLEALAVYGLTCVKCGETDTDILQLDHIDGGGVAHFKEVKVNMAQWAKRNGYPPIFQTLCPNCNFLKHFK